MISRTITVTGIEPASLMLRHPLGIDLDLQVKMLKQNGAAYTLSLPQFVLLPRNSGGVRPFDMTIFDAANGIAGVEVPGSDLQDVDGYGIEIYTRRANDVEGNPPVPTALAARGHIVLEGSAYGTQGPLRVINVPMVQGKEGPPGPPGPMGASVAGPTGQRGSKWFTGTGVPIVPGEVFAGDMYLDEDNGDVYRYDGTTWVRGSF